MSDMQGKGTDPYRNKRYKMVREQIEARGVTSPMVLKAMRKVPRHCFITDDIWFEAYEDYPIPIGYEQTISQPYIVAYMTEALRPKKTHRVLEIGTGCGYQAAVLAELVREVYTLEIVEELHLAAKERLAGMGYSNIHCLLSDGYMGYRAAAPYDLIITTAAPDEIPQELVDQLANGGRMCLPVGKRGQELLLISKDLEGHVTREALMAVRFVPMVHRDS